MRALLIAPDLPWPIARHGAAQRTELMRRALSEVCQTDVAVACIGRSETVPEATHIVAVFREETPTIVPTRSGFLARLFPLQNLNREIDAYYQRHSGLVEWCKVQVDSRHYDFVVVRYLRTAALTGLLEAPPSVPVFLDFDDVDWLKETTRIGELDLPRRWQHWFARANRHRERLCRSIAARATHVWTASAAEQSSVMLPHISLLPNIPFELPSLASLPRAELRPTVLFVALMSYRPNSEGLDRFIRRSWPRVRAALPDARLRVVGKGLDAEHAKRWDQVPGVELVGYVDDLDREYADCHCTICPVHWGGGSNIKVLESIGHRRASVVSSRVARQLDAWLPAGHGVVEATDDELFGDEVSRLLRPSAAADECVLKGQELLRQRLSFEAFAARVRNDILSRLPGQKDAP